MVASTLPCAALYNTACTLLVLCLYFCCLLPFWGLYTWTGVVLVFVAGCVVEQLEPYRGVLVCMAGVSLGTVFWQGLVG